jgi:curved DNA-binding protein CbpA
MAIRKPTLYQLLMVDPGVDDDVLTIVYRRLVQRTHLAYDDDGRRRERLDVIEQAYAILHDAERRHRYDLRVAGIPDRSALPIMSDAPAVIPVEQTPSRQPAEPAAAVAVRPVATAKPAGSRASGTTVLDFGRYAGWSLRQVALRDPDYLEWLRRTPGGRQYQAEIASMLTPR